ncbi:MAG: type IV pilus assembly protein PilM [Candidatus Curtissbacteria bacterium]|nr:type IV pilus assembly protein PilM [Candidatus Curtissbacteria bacterium]
MSARLFGLDIGRSYIKVAAVDVSRNRKVLTAAGIISSPVPAFLSSSESDLSKVVDAVKRLVEEVKIETDKCSVSLMESQVISRLIQIPKLTDKELAAAVVWEAEQYIPLPIKDVVLQHNVVNTTNPQHPGGEKMDVLLVAAPKRVVERYIRIVRECHFKVNSIESESFSLARSLTQPTDASTIIVSFGAFSTELTITNRGSVIFTRSVSTGGANLTKIIMREFNLPTIQAEQYKQSYGVSPDKLSGKLVEALGPSLEVVVTEILRGVEFSKSHVSNWSGAKIVLCGGGAYLPGLSEYLVGRTNLDVTIGDPWVDFVKEGLITKIPGQGTVYAVATGLALRS